MFRSWVKKFRNFLNDKGSHPILAIFAASLYALLYYYDKNYALLNSRSQFAFLVSLYFLLPLLAFYLLNAILGQKRQFKKYRLGLLTIFNLSCFFMTIVVSLYGFDILKLLVALVLGVILGVFFNRYLKKIIIIQLILALMVFPFLIPDLYREITYSKLLVLR